MNNEHVDDCDTEILEVLPDNQISITFGEINISIGGCASFDELEERLFGIIDRLDQRMNTKPPHNGDVA